MRDELWDGCSPAAKGALKSELLKCMAEEPNAYIRKNVCDTVGELGAHIVGDGEWPELLPFIFQCVNFGDVSKLRVAGLKK